MRPLKRELKETLVYLVLWLFLFAAPVLTTYVRSVTDSHLGFEWREVLSVWRLFALYLVIFIIHNYLLAPMLVYRQKKMLYFTSVGLMLAAFILYQCQAGGMRNDFPPMHDGGPGAPMEKPEGMRGEPTEGEMPPPPPFRDEADRGMPPSERRDFQTPPPEPKDKPLAPIGLEDVFSVMVFLLMLGMNLGIKLYFKADEDAKEMRELEKKSLEQQLAYLKYQINPHFFMNTLNNIHALVDIDPEKSKETILVLSKIMRYVLYEGDKDMIPVQREVDFINNYIELMKIRYTDKVKIEMSISEPLPDVGIPPLLLMTFVENAFKHGISYQRHSFISIKVTVDNNRLKFTCRNSKADDTTAEKQQGGVGLPNIKQRLNLLYGESYTLDFEETAEAYEVLLLLPLTR